jgi:hypothetical protein
MKDFGLDCSIKGLIDIQRLRIELNLGWLNEFLRASDFTQVCHCKYILWSYKKSRSPIPFFLFGGWIVENKFKLSNSAVWMNPVILNHFAFFIATR